MTRDIWIHLLHDHAVIVAETTAGRQWVMGNVVVSVFDIGHSVISIRINADRSDIEEYIRRMQADDLVVEVT